jgi:hypothetical protein
MSMDSISMCSKTMFMYDVDAGSSLSWGVFLSWRTHFSMLSIGFFSKKIAMYSA